MSDKHNKSLFYFTAQYPYGEGEQFIVNEVYGLAKHYEKVYLIPARPDHSDQRKLPDNCEVLIADIKSVKSGLNLTDVIMIFSVFTTELFKSGKVKGILKNLRTLQSNLKYAIKRSKAVQQLVQDHKDENLSFYSTWMNINALSLAVLKKRKIIPSFCFKMRGFDLFDERRKDHYMPFRVFIFKQANQILSMSKMGMNYLKKKNIFPDKIHFNHPGIAANKRNQNSADPLTIVSCSGLVELKRCEYIARALLTVEFPIRWVHFGGGPEFENIHSIVENCPDHIEIELRGNTPNKDVLKFYSNEPVDAFIHVSETEGFGYAIIEAYSSGLPSILYPAGGVQELIGKEFTIQVEDPFSEDKIVEAIKKFKFDFWKKNEPRNAAFDFFNSNFSIDQNVSELHGFIEAQK